MLCERRKIREVNTRYTETISGIKTEYNFCSHCAREINSGQYIATLDGEFLPRKLPSGLLGLEDDEEEIDACGKVMCPACGTSFDDPVESSRFGCPDCHGVFDLLISNKMEQLQGGGNHRGKHPKFRDTFEKEHPTQASVGETKETTDSATIQENGMSNRSVAVSKQICESETRSKETMK